MPELVRIREEFMKTLGESLEIDEEMAELNIVERIVKTLVKIFAPML